MTSNISEISELESLIYQEGWDLVEQDGEVKIKAYGELYDIMHPVGIHLKLYRESKNPEVKFMHMKAGHDYLWPDAIWHSWTEQRFIRHCQGWSFMTWAGGASAAKSRDAAVIAILFWLAQPTKRTVIVASTTLESIEARIWGYITKLLKQMKIKFPILPQVAKHPKIINDPKFTDTPKLKDTIHGMFAVAAKQGDDEETIKSWIGRHPDKGLMVILDEATDMPPAIMKAFPNLRSGQEVFQCVAIGNSNDKNDLHGAMSTPKAGWETIDPKVDYFWETNLDNGCCMFFSCYDSPRIWEKDPDKKAKLSFLLDEKQLEEKKLEYGEDSDGFWRFVIGFWKPSTAASVVVTKEFAEGNLIQGKTEWSGLKPLRLVAGLDPSFSTGGDHCVLRMGLMGQDTNGNIVLDYRDKELLFYIPIYAKGGASEVQIAKQVISILKKRSCQLKDLAVDSNGQGRALTSVIAYEAKQQNIFLDQTPKKIYSVRLGDKQKESFDATIVNSYDLWFALRDYIMNKQLRGLDDIALFQLTHRKAEYNAKTKKTTLESKSDFKNRMTAINPSMARSPDEADAAALALQIAIMNYGFAPGQYVEIPKPRSILEGKLLAAHQQITEASQAQTQASAFFSPVARFGGTLESFAARKKQF